METDLERSAQNQRKAKQGMMGRAGSTLPRGLGRGQGRAGRPFQASFCRGLPVLKPRWAWGPRGALEMVQQGSAGSHLPFVSL